MWINQAVLARREIKSPTAGLFSSWLLLQDSLRAKCSFRWKLRLNGTALGEAEQRAGTSKPVGREPVSAGSGLVGETFGPLPGYEQSPMIERSSGSLLN